MAWEDGSELMSQLIEIIKESIVDFNVRMELYESMMEVLQEHDYNAFGDCKGIDKAYDRAWEEIYGHWEDDEDDDDDDEDDDEDVFQDRYANFGEDDY